MNSHQIIIMKDIEKWENLLHILKIEMDSETKESSTLLRNNLKNIQKELQTLKYYLNIHFNTNEEYALIDKIVRESHQKLKSDIREIEEFNQEETSVDKILFSHLNTVCNNIKSELKYLRCTIMNKYVEDSSHGSVAKNAIHKSKQTIDTLDRRAITHYKNIKNTVKNYIDDNKDMLVHAKKNIQKLFSGSSQEANK